MFGCGEMAMGATLESGEAASLVVSGESCETGKSHDCCARKKALPKKQNASTSKPPKGSQTLKGFPRGMMKDCPLAANATAVASKFNGHEPGPGRDPVSVTPVVDNKFEQSNALFAVGHIPNRGPTHLRCCVFLI